MSSPLTMSFGESFAVSIRMGVRLPRCFRRRPTSNPFRFGIITSRIRTSNGRARAKSRPSDPSPATTVTWPSRSSPRFKRATMRSSSSTIRISTKSVYRTCAEGEDHADLRGPVRGLRRQPQTVVEPHEDVAGYVPLRFRDQRELIRRALDSEVEPPLWRDPFQILDGVLSQVERAAGSLVVLDRGAHGESAPVEAAGQTRSDFQLHPRRADEDLL